PLLISSFPIGCVVPSSTLLLYTTLFRSFLARARYGLLQKSSYVVGGRPVDMSGPLALVPRKLRRQYGVVLDREIDVILDASGFRSEEHTSELQSLENLVCRLLLEKKKTT